VSPARRGPEGAAESASAHSAGPGFLYPSVCGFVGLFVWVVATKKGLKNIIFSMMIGYFSVFSAFRCAMFYMSFLSHLLKKPQ
jgi:hypothetical protein